MHTVGFVNAVQVRNCSYWISCVKVPLVIFRDIFVHSSWFWMLYQKHSLLVHLLSRWAHTVHRHSVPWTLQMNERVDTMEMNRWHRDIRINELKAQALKKKKKKICLGWTPLDNIKCTSCRKHFPHSPSYCDHMVRTAKGLKLLWWTVSNVSQHLHNS